MPVYRVCRKKEKKRKKKKKEIEKEKEKVKSQLHSAKKNFISIIYILNFNCLYAFPCMFLKWYLLADCDDVSIEHLLKHKNHGRS